MKDSTRLAALGAYIWNEPKMHMEAMSATKSFYCYC